MADKEPVTPEQKKMTKEAAVDHVIKQLSLLGWHVALETPALSKTTLIVTSSNNAVRFTVRSRGQSQRDELNVGKDLQSLSDWWIVTRNPRSNNPTSYILSKQDVLDASPRRDGDGDPYYLKWQSFERDEFKDG